ncbi:MAG: hypothetical protein LUD14_13250 [Clostridiales bacterium]|nr:hypothetical protein [Clostridiales bacterium]
MDDWNGDGRNDWNDGYFFHENFMKSGSGGKSSGGGGGGSNIIIILCVFSGILWQALIYMAFDIDVDNVPVIVMLLLWFVFSTITFLLVTYLMDKFR